MPSSPWTATAELDPRREYYVMATRFVATGRRHLPGIFRATQAIWPALTAADGLLGYRLRAGLAGGTLSTLSVWRDRDAMTRFVRGSAHGEVVEKTRHRLAGSTFTGWTALGAQLPPSWEAAAARART